MKRPDVGVLRPDVREVDAIRTSKFGATLNNVDEFVVQFGVELLVARLVGALEVFDGLRSRNEVVTESRIPSVPVFRRQLGRFVKDVADPLELVVKILSLRWFLEGIEVPLTAQGEDHSTKGLSIELVEIIQRYGVNVRTFIV